MIGSTGLFQGIMCPYESECRRPNCHYFHMPKAESQNSQASMLSSQISQYSEPMETQQPSTSSRPMIIQQENVDDFQGYVGYVAQTSADNSDIPSYSTTTSNVATQETTFSTTIYNSAMPFPPQSGAMFAGMPGYNQFYQVAYQPSLYAPEDPACSLYAPEDPIHAQHQQPGYHKAQQPHRSKSAHVKFMAPEKNESNSRFSPPPQKVKTKSKPPVYIPTPINKTKKLKEKDLHLKRRSASPSGQFSVLDKPILPVDLADDEILNPIKRDAAISKAAEEYKKKKLEKPKPVSKKFEEELFPKKVEKPRPESKKSTAPTKDQGFRIPKKPTESNLAEVSKSADSFYNISKSHESASSTVDRILHEAKVTQEKKFHVTGNKTSILEKKSIEVSKTGAPPAKLQSVNEYVKKVAEIDKKIHELEQGKVEKKKIMKPSSSTVSHTKIETKKIAEPLDIDSLFEDEDEPPSLPIPPKKTKPEHLPEIEPKKTQKLEAKSFYEKSKNEEKLRKDFEKDFIEDSFWTTTDSPKAEKPKAMEPSTSSDGAKPRIAHSTVGNVKHSLPIIKSKAPSAQEQLRNRMEKYASSRDEEPVLKKPKMEESHRVQAVAATVPKGEARKAHAPTLNVKSKTDDEKLTKAVVPIDMKSPKIGLAIRSRYLKMLYDEYVKTCSTKNDAVSQAQAEEYAILNKSNTKPGYLAAVASSLKRLREANEQQKQATSGGSKKYTFADTVSHETHVMMGRHAGNISVGIHRSRKSFEISEVEFYEALYENYLLNEEQLRSNSYPLWEDDKMKRVKITNSERDANKQLYVDDSDFHRVCCRCGKQYRITKDGHFVNEDDCIYHWGKPWKKKFNGAWDTRYNCCDSDLTVKGCVYAECHVSQSLRKSILTQFVETPQPEGPQDPRSRRVYALDCEMVYTSWGPEVARLSMVDYNDDIVIDDIIRPDSLVLDTNSRFSGLTVEMVEGADYNLEMIREKLFKFINSETILVGHSLESDLKTLRIVHKNVVDTGVVFPHRLGPPYKRALKTLTSEILQKIIQEEETGHDSKEDASACMKLMIHKIKND